MANGNTEDSASKNTNKNDFLPWLCLACSAPLICLLFELWHYPRLISPGLGMRIMAANLLIKGELPYYDFWDWSQPIVFELLKYPYLLCTTLQTMLVPITHALFIPLFILALLVGSTALAAVIGLEFLKIKGNDDKDEGENFVSSCLLALVLTALITRFDFGDLQLCLLLTMVPWLVLRWFTHKGLKVSPALSLFTGIIAAIGACLDLPYLGVFVVLELVMVLLSGRWRCLLSSDCLGFVITFATNLLVLSQLPEPIYTAFWKWTMPLKWLNYSVFDGMIYAPQACPNRADVLYCLVTAGILSFLLGKKYDAYVTLSCLMFAGFALYLLEGQGSSHDLILTIFAITAIFTSVLLRLIKKVNYQPLLLILTLVSTAAIWQSLEHDRAQLQQSIIVNCSKGKEQFETLLEQSSKVGDSVSVISRNIEPAYPLLFLADRKPGSYLLWGRPLWLFAWLKDNSQLQGPMKDFYDHTYNNIRTELEQNKTKVVIISNPEPFDRLEHEQYLRALELNYNDLEKDGNFFSYENHQPHEYSGYNFAYRFLARQREPGK